MEALLLDHELRSERFKKILIIDNVSIILTQSKPVLDSFFGTHDLNAHNICILL